MMNKPEWYDVLEPREAVIAGVVGLVTMWALTYYASQAGYVFWGYSLRNGKTSELPWSCSVLPFRTAW